MKDNHQYVTVGSNGKGLAFPVKGYWYIDNPSFLNIFKDYKLKNSFPNIHEVGAGLGVVSQRGRKCIDLKKSEK